MGHGKPHGPCGSSLTFVRDRGVSVPVALDADAVSDAAPRIAWLAVGCRRSLLHSHTATVIPTTLFHAHNIAAQGGSPPSLLSLAVAILWTARRPTAMEDPTFEGSLAANHETRPRMHSPGDPNPIPPGVERCGEILQTVDCSPAEHAAITCSLAAYFLCFPRPITPAKCRQDQFRPYSWSISLPSPSAGMQSSLISDDKLSCHA
jgi:hypothetical protein